MQSHNNFLIIIHHPTTQSFLKNVVQIKAPVISPLTKPNINVHKKPKIKIKRFQ